MSAPYNPDTLKRIRQGASARDLGWDATFYANVCRRHQIEYVPVTAVPSAVVDPAPKPKPGSKPYRGPKTTETITISLPIAYYKRIKAVSDAGGHKRGVSVSAQVRGCIDRALAANTLPVWRISPDDNLRVYATVTCPIATVEMIEAQSKALGINRAEFIRRAIAFGLEQQP